MSLRLSLVIDGDAGGAKKALEETTRAVEDLARKTEATGSNAYSGWGKGASEAAEGLKAAGEEAQGAAGALEAVDNAGRNAARGVQDAGREAAAATEKFGGLKSIALGAVGGLVAGIGIGIVSEGFKAAVTAAQTLYTEITSSQPGIERALKSHAELVGRIKGAYSEASGAASSYGLNSLALLRFQSQQQIKDLQDALGAAQGDLIGAGAFNPTVAAGGGGGRGLGPFRDAVNEIRADLRDGRADIIAFREEVAKIAEALPSDSEFRPLAETIFGDTQQAAELQAELQRQRDLLKGLMGDADAASTALGGSAEKYAALTGSAGEATPALDGSAAAIGRAGAAAGAAAPKLAEVDALLKSIAGGTAQAPDLGNAARGSLTPLVGGAGFAAGGYTGGGRDDEVAGFAHRNEFVFSAAATRRIGASNLQALHSGALRGYATGGLVGGHAGAGYFPPAPALGSLSGEIDRLNRGVRDLAQTLAGMFSRPLSAGETFFQRMMSSASQLGQAISKSGVFGKAGSAVGAGLTGLGTGFGAQDPLMGAIGGGLSGFVSGGPVGGIIGGIAGLIGGIIGQQQKQREEAAALARTLQDLSLRTLRATADTSTLAGELTVFDAQASQEIARLREQRKSATEIAATEVALAAERLAIVRRAEADRSRAEVDAAARRRDDVAQVLRGAYDHEMGLLRELASARRAFAEDLTWSRNAMRLDPSVTPLDPGRRLAEAERQYREADRLAGEGDEAAMARFTEVARTWVAEAISYFGPTVDAFAVFHEVDARMAELVGTSLREAVAADQQQATLDAQVGHLIGIETGVASVAQALADFHAANSAAQAAQLSYDQAQLAAQQQQTAALQQLAANQTAAPAQAMPSLLERIFNAGGSSQGLFDRIFNWTPGFARGAAFERGVQRFALGGVPGSGIVDRPTLFPMANGAGLMGEAGPEAIMPLRRGADGRLGVAANSNATNDNGAWHRLADAQAEGADAIVAAIDRLTTRMDAMERGEDRRARAAAKSMRTD